MSYFGNMKERNAQPCSVSIDVVQHVASLMPEHLMTDSGQPIIPRILFMLGFQVDERGQGYAMYENVRIRNRDCLYLTYVTTIFNGRVRNEVSHKLPNGNIVYTNTTHRMERAYMENEILTMSGLDTSLMENIDNIGLEKYYTESMNNMDRRVDPEKTMRNIVR